MHKGKVILVKLPSSFQTSRRTACALKRTVLVAVGIVLSGVLLAGCGLLATPTPLPTPTRLPRATSTPTPIDTPTPTDTSTPTPLPPTATPTIAPPTQTSVPPTMTPRPSATPTALPPTQTATPRPPTATPLPTNTPTPSIDFVVVKKRLLTRTENGGQCQGNILFYVSVQDAQGQPLNGIVVHMLWDGVTPNLIVDNTSGADGPGAVRIIHSAGIFRLVVVKDASGRTYTSEIADQLITDDPPEDWKRAAGYCNVDPGKCEYCFGHYSYEVVFKRTW